MNKWWRMQLVSGFTKELLLKPEREAFEKNMLCENCYIVKSSTQREQGLSINL